MYVYFSEYNLDMYCLIARFFMTHSYIEKNTSGMQKQQTKFCSLEVPEKFSNNALYILPKIWTCFIHFMVYFVYCNNILCFFAAVAKKWIIFSKKTAAYAVSVNIVEDTVIVGT